MVTFFFEEVIREHIGLGYPEQVSLIFSRICREAHGLTNLKNRRLSIVFTVRVFKPSAV